MEREINNGSNGGGFGYGPPRQEKKEVCNFVVLDYVCRYPSLCAILERKSYVQLRIIGTGYHEGA